MIVLPRFPTVFLFLPLGLAAQSGFPFTGETLHYSISWQSGLNLGDATFTAQKTSSGWDFHVTADAPLPGFAINDRFHSTTNPELCSTQFDRELSHGSLKTTQKITFDLTKREAERTTTVPNDGGKSTLDIPACPRDAVAFAYFARKELGQGRVPPAQQVFYGSGYSVHMDYTGAQNLRLGDKPPVVTDHLVVSVKGPKSDFNFEVFYARDAARTPLSIRIPSSMGTFSMDVVR